jgi:hypothetical protein
MVKEVSFRVVAVIVCLLWSGSIVAQDEENYPWVIYAHTGIGAFLSKTYETELNHLLKESENYSQLYLINGVGVAKAISQKLMVGGEFYGINNSKVRGDNTSVSIWSVGGIARVSYNLAGLDDWNLASFAGLGFNISNTNISNEGFLVNRSPIYIPPGREQIIRGQLGMVDLGIQIVRKSDTSLSWGFLGGFQQRLIGSDWKATWGESVSYLSVPAHSLFYGRVMVCYSIP